MAEATKAIREYFKGAMVEDSMLIGGHTAGKQVSGGPERLGFLNSVSNRVLLASFLAGEANARLLVDAQGNFEWGEYGEDQDVLLYHVFKGRMNFLGDPGGGLGVIRRQLEAAKTITGATNATPIVITTSTAHGYTTGNRIFIENVGGNGAANGVWAITVLSPTTFSLTRSVGSGTYTSGGTAKKISGIEGQARIVLYNDGSGIGFSDGVNVEKAWLYNSTAGILNALGVADGGLGVLQNTDGYHRIMLENNGAGIRFGSGADIPDVALYRSTAGRLAVDGEFYVTQEFIAHAKASLDNILQHNGESVGFYGIAATIRGEVTGARSDPEAALKNLLSALAATGIIQDSTSP
ncbi:MAG: hypothetical protein HYS38_10185 [Acidobacteria bacterium]|nr:hypothetical protein [Acidobacteriota bacterium]